MIFTAMSDGRFDLGSRWCDCALGRGGVTSAAAKQEGDGCSPLGVWPIRRLLYRPDRMLPALAAFSACPKAAIAPNDGWCDAPLDPNYNQPVQRPYPASSEVMWREDHLYDVVVVLGHNDHPPIPGKGSAIFLHIARPDYAPTAGCVALSAHDMTEFLAALEPGSSIAIVAAAHR